jgi:AAHS family 4-hydroxybenzoate transporter-like MFS transporter
MPIILVAIAIIMVDGFDLQAIGFVAPDIARSWSVDIAAFGPVFSAALAGSILGALAAGPWVRRMGLRTVLAVSLAVFGGGTFAAAWASDLLELGALRFIVGMGLGAAVPIVLSLVAAHSPPRIRATALVVTLCGQPVGAILGAALCAHFMPVHGWRFAFYLGGALPLLLIPAVLRIREPDARPCAQSEKPGRVRDLFSIDLRKPTLLLWASSFLTVFFVYIIVNWLPSAVRGAGHSLGASVSAIQIFNAGGIAGAILLGVLMDRHGPLRVIPFALGLAGISFASLDVLQATPVLFMTATFVCGLAGYGGSMSFGSLTALLYPAHLRTTGVGWVMGIGRLGAAVGPLGAGLALAAGVGISRLFYFAAAAAVLVMGLLVTLARVLRGR